MTAIRQSKHHAVMGVAVVLLATALVSVMTASQAHAAYIPGNRASWHYNSASTIYGAMAVPGVELVLSGTDDAGTRTVTVTLSDKSLDGRCGHVYFNALGDYSTQAKVCGNGRSTVIALRPTDKPLHIWLYSLRESDPSDALTQQAVWMAIAPSIDDPSLRTTYTNYLWDTINPGRVAFTLSRKGVLVRGQIVERTTAPYGISMSYTVAPNVAIDDTCAIARAEFGPKPVVESAFACDGDEVEVSIPYFNPYFSSPPSVTGPQGLVNACVISMKPELYTARATVPCLNMQVPTGVGPGR